MCKLATYRDSTHKYKKNYVQPAVIQIKPLKR